LPQKRPDRRQQQVPRPKKVYDLEHGEFEKKEKRKWHLGGDGENKWAGVVGECGCEEVSTSGGKKEKGLGPEGSQKSHLDKRSNIGK